MLMLALSLLAAPPATVDREVLQQLLVVDTSHGHETEALQPILKRFQAAGVPVQLLESAPGRGNLIARIKGTGAQRPLLLMAHIDVVPVEGQKWTTAPFNPTERDGYLPDLQAHRARAGWPLVGAADGRRRGAAALSRAGQAW